MTGEPDHIYYETFQINAIECDFNQALKPAILFQHLTESAVVHATQLGVGFDAMIAQNLVWVHSRMKIKFYGFPRVGDTIAIRTWPRTIRRRLVYIRDFEVLDAGGQRLAAATSAWLILNAATHRLAPPKSLNLDLPEVGDRIGLDDPLERIGLEQSGEERLRVRAGYSAVDILGHVNNSRYVEWICDAFPLELFRQRRLDWMQINYEHEVLPGEEVSILAHPIDVDPDLWALEGLNRSNSGRAFEALLRWQN